MAGGKITRVTLGTSIKEIEENFTIHTDYFTMNSGGKGYFSSDKEILIADPEKPKPVGKYFKRGWWTDENDNSIKEAELGDIVRFHIEMTNNFPIKGTIGTSLYDDDVKQAAEESDGSKGSDSIELSTEGNLEFKVLNYREVLNRKIVIRLKLGG